MNKNHLRNYTQIFKSFDDQRLGAVPRVLSKIGSVLFAVYLGGQILFLYFGQTNKTGAFVYDFTNWVIIATAIGFIGGATVLALVGIYYIGAQNGIRTFLPALIYVMKRVALYIFLPAVLLGALMGVIVYLFTR